MDTIEVRRKKRNWYVVGLVMGVALGYLIREITSIIQKISLSIAVWPEVQDRHFPFCTLWRSSILSDNDITSF